MTTTQAIVSTYRRAQHAAHYGYGHPSVGHDLEQWDVTDATRRYPVRPGDVPSDVQFHHGYLDLDGVQHLVFTRIAPLSGETCVRCPQ